MSILASAPVSLCDRNCCARMSIATVTAFRTSLSSLPTTGFSSLARSEERRVGKECRSRWAAEHEKKKARRIRCRSDECTIDDSDEDDPESQITCVRQVV